MQLGISPLSLHRAVIPFSRARGSIKADMQPAPEILDYLAKGGLVVSANPRASRVLRRAYADSQLAKSVSAWHSPTVADWSSFLSGFWQEHVFAVENPPILLTPLQESWLWQRILKGQPEARSVMEMEPLAKLAERAYLLLSEYDSHPQRQHPWSIRSEDSLSDPEAFRRWAAAFDRECSKLHAVSRSQLAAIVAKDIRENITAAPEEIRLLGFDRLTPAQDTVLDALKDAGCVVSALDMRVDNTGSHIVLAKNCEDEIATCASWLRFFLAGNRDKRVAVIAPNVQPIRGHMERVFRRVLLPDSMQIAQSPAPLPFEFSLGIPLATVPIVRGALLLLRWLSHPLLAEEVSWLLLSGFIAPVAADILGLAEIDSAVRNSGLMPLEMSLTSFLSEKSLVSTSSAAKTLRDRLFRMQKMGVGKPRRPAMEWTERSLELLTIAGWPGTGGSDSVDYQARKKFVQLTESIASIGFEDSLVEEQDFLSFLEKQAHDAIFAPESQDALVQILGPAESAGQTFDAVWFLGADENNWPAIGRPHPLLPIAVQRSVGMPHTNTAADLEFAQNVTARILQISPVAIFSYSQQNVDGALRPSPLLPSGLVTTSEDFRTKLHLESEPEIYDRTEKVSESEDIPWPESVSAGGYSVLKMQSACPFQAFASKRLGAGEMSEAQWGLSPAHRGQLLHKVLERLWSPSTEDPSCLHSSEDLRHAIQNGELDAIIHLHIEAVFQTEASTRELDSWSRAYMKSEKEHLHSVLRTWLEYENARHPFEVEAREKKLTDVKVGPLHLDLRVDRVDLLPEDGRLLIDYKTGKVSTTQWKVPRLEEPQLPLYAVYGGLENVQGVCFAQIRVGESKFIGHLKDAQSLLMSDLTNQSPLVANKFDDELREAWRADLLAVATEFTEGKATVSPKNYPKTCEYCPFTALCRVRESDVPLQFSDSAIEANGIEEEEIND
jgi:ATP-dependent helicase/nuclease subunit B